MKDEDHSNQAKLYGIPCVAKCKEAFYDYIEERQSYSVCEVRDAIALALGVTGGQRLMKCSNAAFSIFNNYVANALAHFSKKKFQMKLKNNKKIHSIRLPMRAFTSYIPVCGHRRQKTTIYFRLNPRIIVRSRKEHGPKHRRMILNCWKPGSRSFNRRSPCCPRRFSCLHLQVRTRFNAHKQASSASRAIKN